MSRLSLIVDLAAMLPRRVDLDTLLGAACERIAVALDAERATLWLVDADQHYLVARAAVLPELEELRQPLSRGLAGHVARSGESLNIADVRVDSRFDPTLDRATGFQTINMVVVPVRETPLAPVRAVLQVLNHRGGPFSEEDARYVEALAGQLAAALALTTLRARDASAIGVTRRGRFNRVVGLSQAMAVTYDRIAVAAETDATVLLHGETGTGKSLLARAIHDNSNRQGRPFVTVDCTTIAPQLIESELFGHERGAFTGADRKVVGRVELAEDGTLFLDEIGDLPLEVQGKLLRLLQEREYERVGGREVRTTSARILAATHRDLRQLVRQGRFREDLYYRVRVVEIVVPPLRERGAAEVELLIEHFGAIYAKRYGRPTPQLAPEVTATIRRHTWPGNVRELEHWVESVVALSRTGEVGESMLPPSMRLEHPEALRHVTVAAAGPSWVGADGSTGRAGVGAAAPDPGRSPRASAAERDRATCDVCLPLDLPLEEAERRYVTAVLAACDDNKSEAARRLGIGRNRLARLLGE